MENFKLTLSLNIGDTFSLLGNQGFQLMTFQNESLGWIKHLGNRFNNLYPKEWRIRMNIYYVIKKSVSGHIFNKFFYLLFQETFQRTKWK